MPTCIINNRSMNSRSAYRNSNGNITVEYYCYSKGSSSLGNQQKLTHPECKNRVFYKNGEGYNLKNKINFEEKYRNLIGCWCNDYLRFATPVEAQNHRLEKHPEEFEN